MDIVRALVERLNSVCAGFESEGLNGVICSIPEAGVDAPTGRMWCKRCQARWRELFAIRDALNTAVETSTKDGRLS